MTHAILNTLRRLRLMGLLLATERARGPCELLSKIHVTLDIRDAIW